MVDINSVKKNFSGQRSQMRAQALAEGARVLDLAARAGRRLEACLNEGLAAAGLSSAQGRALRAIAAEPGLTVGRLTARLGISKQSLAPVLKALTAGGLVEAAGAPTDRRLRLLHLTAEGETAWGEAARGALELLSAASAETGPGGTGGFHAMLQHLTELPAGREANGPDRGGAP